MITKIETRIRSYEIDGQEVKGVPSDADDLIVRGHRIRNDLVILDWHGIKIAVSARDLNRAIQNATNHGL